MRVDDAGWLERDPRVRKLPTVRIGKLVEGGPRAIVWHATGSVGSPRFSESLATRIQRYRRGVDRPASWHVLVSRAGEIFQSAPLTVATWHVGRPGTIAGVRYSNVNAATIGIELENAGPLAGVKGSYYAWPYWLDRASRKPDPRLTIPGDRVERLAGVPYDCFPAAQTAAALALLLALTRYRRWGREALSYCHADFAAPAKTDPGALWKTRVLPALLDEALSLRVEEADPAALTVVTGPPTFASV